MQGFDRGSVIRVVFVTAVSLPLSVCRSGHLTCNNSVRVFAEGHQPAGVIYSMAIELIYPVIVLSVCLPGTAVGCVFRSIYAEDKCKLNDLTSGAIK